MGVVEFLDGIPWQWPTRLVDNYSITRMVSANKISFDLLALDQSSQHEIPLQVFLDLVAFELIEFHA